MDIAKWDQRYRSGQQPEDLNAAPAPLVVETARRLRPGRALDLACGTGRNALWLAAQGWKVTAVDGAPAAIEILQRRAAQSGVVIDARIADLERSEYAIEPGQWDLILMCYYLRRDLFEPAKRGVSPGGVLLAIVHITDPGEQPTAHRLRPGELKNYFQGWRILHYREGRPDDPAHRRLSAEIVAAPATLGEWTESS